jgi:hypothetical protein
MDIRHALPGLLRISLPTGSVGPDISIHLMAALQDRFLGQLFPLPPTERRRHLDRILEMTLVKSRL